MSQPTIAAGFVSAILDYAERRGAERAELLDAAGLDATVLSDQDARVPIAAYQALIAAGIAATGDTALLLRHTLESKLETISVVGQIVHSARSLAHAIEQLNRYLRLMADVDVAGHRDRFELREDAGAAWIVDHVAVCGPDYVALEASFARFISEFRRSFPHAPFALALEVTYPAPPHAHEYPDLLRIPVRFDAARNALRIDPVWLGTESEFEPGHAYSFGVFTRHADALLASLGRSDRLRDRIEAAILPALHEGSLSMDKLARDLAMSRQTLYRRLKAEGETFAGIHDDLRRRMALDYLTARKVSVNETAYLLGFSEASSFVRAFRRWTGQSPTAYLARGA